MREGSAVALLSLGTRLGECLRAADQLAALGLSATVADARFAKPIDMALVRSLLERRIPIVTVEDHSIVGGFGAAVLEAAQEMNLDASRLVRLGLPDSWIIQDSRAKQLAQAGIDQQGIARGIRRAAELGSTPSKPGSLPEIHVARSSMATTR